MVVLRECLSRHSLNYFVTARVKPGSYFLRMRMRREFDVTTFLSQWYLQVSWAELNCCELFVANLWRQHSLRIRRKYEPAFLGPTAPSLRSFISSRFSSKSFFCLSCSFILAHSASPSWFLKTSTRSLSFKVSYFLSRAYRMSPRIGYKTWDFIFITD